MTGRPQGVAASTFRPRLMFEVASEMVGAVRGVDPETGYPFDDTKRYVDGVPSLSDAERTMIFEGNVREVFSRLEA